MPLRLTDSHDGGMRLPRIKTHGTAFCRAGALFQVTFWRITASVIRTGERSAMQALIEMIASFVAMLAVAALSQFGLDLRAPQKPDREIHRVRDCGGSNAPSTVITVSNDRKHEC
jgi:hypothetical protein